MKEVEDNKCKATPVAMVAPELKQNAEADTEITKTCAVLGCEESKNFNSDSFFRFPEDANLRQIWTDLTGRNNWTPTDFSYICVQHFSVDCFECDSENRVILTSKAVPSLKLPNHVLEVEYIDEETLDHEDDEEDEEYEMESEEEHSSKPNKQIRDKHISNATTEHDNVELLKLFTEVQRMQRQAIGLRDKLKCNMRVYNRQNSPVVIPPLDARWRRFLSSFLLEREGANGPCQTKQPVVVPAVHSILSRLQFSAAFRRQRSSVRRAAISKLRAERRVSICD
ncbi:unnamed protein product, partial [Iphiclides podalirius]